MKVYNLTIVFNEESEEIEYIEETLENEIMEDGAVIKLIEKEDSDRSSTIESLMQLHKIAEA
jgi:hypothetical protein